MRRVAMHCCILSVGEAAGAGDERYPSRPVCVDCIAAQHALGSQSPIIAVGKAILDVDAECALCGCRADRASIAGGDGGMAALRARTG